jgi:hypothetical protein
LEFYDIDAAVRCAARHVEEFRSCHGNHPMGISISSLTLQVMISEPQGLYHPRLPAPFPSDVHGVLRQPTAGSTGSSVASGTSLSSGSPGSLRHGSVDLRA